MHYEDRTNKYNRAVITVATAEYNQFIHQLITSAHYCFQSHVYLFTDQPDDYAGFKDITVFFTPHLGWPIMPLLRFELLNKYTEFFKENYLFLIDSEAEFMRPVGTGIFSHRVATLHRNIMRFRSDYNYEKRINSTAYVAPDEGEKYYACGFVGGTKKEFKKMCETISYNIRDDIRNGIRARWGDESHLNRYLIDNPPTLVLPPNYMCPEGNNYFIPIIMHRDKQFKRINKIDTEEYLTVDPNDFIDVWKDLPKV